METQGQKMLRTLRTHEALDRQVAEAYEWLLEQKKEKESKENKK